jgi:hypothetical protein
MKHEGKYIYGIIATNDVPSFGAMGIGGDGDTITTISAEGVAAVVSTASMDHYVISRKNLIAHTTVIEKVMESYTILPMRFCTIAETADEIKDFLKTNASALKDKIKDLDGKIEIDIKIMWKEMKNIYEEIGRENRKIKELKEKKSSSLDRASLIHVGELVATALKGKKTLETKEYLGMLQKKAEEFKEMEITSDGMVLHSAFLIKKKALKEFDTLIHELEERFKDRIDIYYMGPMAPFSFINLDLHWDE